jgi:hypothetical protein
MKHCGATQTIRRRPGILGTPLSRGVTVSGGAASCPEAIVEEIDQIDGFGISGAP